MTSLLQDLRYALRLIARKPALTALAVVSLGLGIGVNTSIFTLVNAVLLRDLPFARPDEMVEVYTTSPGEDLDAYSPSSVPDFLDYREQNDVFAGLAAHRSYPLTYDDGATTELLMGEIVSGNFFDVLGVDAALGRTFLPEEDQTPGAGAVVVLGHVFWQRHFGGDPSVLGRTLRLNGHPFEVVGIVPESFNGTLAIFRSDLWLPLMMVDQVSMNPILERRGSRSLILKGRLKPGVTLEQAQAQLGTIARRLAAEYPETNEERGVNLVPTRDVVLNPAFDGPVFSAAAVLMIVVALVLLIACSNLANLFLAQASDRRKEIALRLALGSGRGRLIRQLLTESLLISFISGLGSLLFATWTARLLVGFRPPIPVPMALDLGVDHRVLGFTLLLAVVTGVLCGLAPALQASRAELVPALKDDAAALGRGSPGGGQMGCYRWFGMRNILVVSQVMISTLLLIGAGLFIRSLMSAQAIDPGFTLREGVTAAVMPQLGGAYTDAEAQVLYRRMRERAAALPGVRSAALAEFLPLGLAASTRRVYVEGRELPEGEEVPGIDAISISPAYFRTMGIALLRGRDFTEHDDTSAPGVVIVNETMARQSWPAEDPLGKRLRLSDAADAPIYEVIGVARDGKYRTLGEAPRPYLYTSIAQEDDFFILTLIVASSAEAETVAMVRQLLDEMAPRLPIFEIKSLSQHLEIMFFLPRMGAGLLAGMGLLGLLLASVGLYGVVAYSVARRTREMGLRMALGASRGIVLRMVIREGMILVTIGTALGVGLALAATRALEGLLYGVTSSDPATFVTVPLFLLGVSLAANFLPARRATGIDPMEALRYE